MWWYLKEGVNLWFPFHEFYLSSYDKYAIEVKPLPDPCERVVIKIGDRNFWYNNYPHLFYNDSIRPN
jgi:hypothetical protein